MFKKELSRWSVCNIQNKNSYGENLYKKVENKMPSQFILSVNDTLETQASSVHEYYIHTWYPALPPHKHVSGSAKIWYSDDDFKSGSTLKVEVFLDWRSPEMRKPDKPCLTMNIPQPQRQGQAIKGQPSFEYIYFGDAHDKNELEFIMKVEMHYSGKNVVQKPISFGLRDLTLHFSNELLNVKHPPVECSLGQALDENLICQNCGANCDVCFGTQPSQCLSCSSGSHWHGSACINCHASCDKCTGPTEYECLGCNFGFFDHGNGVCSETCEWPFQKDKNRFEMLCVSPCKSDEYIWNSTQVCLANCAAPLISFTDRFGHLSCKSPCPNDQDFLYTNGSCLPDCTYPLVAEITHGTKLCKNPCSSTGMYLYPDHSCLSKCPAPLQIRIEPIAKYCENPCHSENLYLLDNGSCTPACPAPLIAEFTAQGRLCMSPCKFLSDYLYANRSCLKDCPAPLQIKSEPAAKFCVNPCHSNNSYLYQNGSCLPTCPSPGKIKEEFELRYCLPPCNLAREYILKDGSCSFECPSPLVRRKEPSVGIYCLNPCESDDHFLSNWRNGSFSCVAKCPNYFEMKIEHGTKYCLSPCFADEYYFVQNHSCLDRCPYPLMIIFEEGISLCQNPCSKSNSFLYDDQSCHESCLKPLIIEEGNRCQSPCLKGSQYVNTDGDCQEACEHPYTVITRGPYKICQIDLSRAQSVQVGKMREIIEVSNVLSELGGVFSCLINSGDPISILMLPLISMFEKIKYTDVALPLESEFLLDQISPGTLENRELLSKSAGHFIQIQNIFDERLLRLGIIFVVAFLIPTLSKLTKSWRGSKVAQLLQKCDSVLRWNTLIPFFMRSCGDMILYSLFEFQNSKLTDPRGHRCILAGILTSFVLYKIFHVSRRMEVNLPRWRFLFEIFSENQRFFISIYFVRVVMYHLVIGLLYDYPLFQAFLMVLMSCGMCSYLIWISPIKYTFSKVQYLIVELALLCYNFIFGVLAAFDLIESPATNVFGQLMNILYLITSVLTAIIIILKTIQIVYSHFKAENSLRTSQMSGHIQMNEDSEQDLPSGRSFEALNQTEMVIENESNLSKILLILELI